jgi:inhibitor of KinA sporulation pathway (predicted exonuclease)
MARDTELEVVNVVDIECTCWKGDPPPGEHNDIIEIGLTELHVKSGEMRAFQYIVYPTTSNVSEFCEELTGLSQTQVTMFSIPFPDVCQKIQEVHRTKHRTWASYGDYDRRQFERQCQRENIPYPFDISHINIKNLFALTFLLEREIGMDKALERMRIPLYGTHHCGKDDAYNSAKILKRLLSRE